MHDELTELHIIQIHVSEPQLFRNLLGLVAALLAMAAQAVSRRFDLWQLLVLHRSLCAIGQNWAGHCVRCGNTTAGLLLDPASDDVIRYVDDILAAMAKGEEDLEPVLAAEDLEAMRPPEALHGFVPLSSGPVTLVDLTRMIVSHLMLYINYNVKPNYVLVWDEEMCAWCSDIVDSTRDTL